MSARKPDGEPCRLIDLLLYKAHVRLRNGWDRKVAMILAAATVLCAALYTDMTAADTVAELVYMGPVWCGEGGPGGDLL